jgi:hypothetical protein
VPVPIQLGEFSLGVAAPRRRRKDTTIPVVPYRRDLLRVHPGADQHLQYERSRFQLRLLTGDALMMAVLAPHVLQSLFTAKTAEKSCEKKTHNLSITTHLTDQC